MCVHKEIELISRIENFQGYESLNLYLCGECKEVLAMQDGMTLEQLNGVLHNSKSRRQEVAHV